MARPIPPPVGPCVRSELKSISPERWLSLGTRRLKARRMSTPNLAVWLPRLFVKLETNWYCDSSCFSGQLQRPNLSPRPVPKLMLMGVLSVPTLLMNPPGRPDEKASLFIPGMPASAAGVVPKSLGNTSTW